MDSTSWNVEELLQNDLQQYGERVMLLKLAADSLPGSYRLYYHLDQNYFHLYCPQKEHAEALTSHFDKHAQIVVSDKEQPEDFYLRPWCFIKSSFSPTARGLSDAMFLTPGPVNAPFGGARPISSMLVGGLAGAGLGYLGGTIAENVLGPKVVREGRLRKLLALAGGLGLAAPGAYWAYSRAADGDPAGLFKQGSWVDAAQAVLQLLPDVHAPEWVVKTAVAGGLFENPGAGSAIPVDAFGQVVWSDHDPFTSASLRAATMGLVQAAGMAKGRSDTASPWVTTGDIARLGVGMGSGYAAGSLAGRTLGVLAGLQPGIQQQLQQAGLWAGALKAVVPPLFGN